MGNCCQSSSSVRDGVCYRDSSGRAKSIVVSDHGGEPTMALYLGPDPDLGWRHLSGYSTAKTASEGTVKAGGGGAVRGEYPDLGYWNMGFQNERSSATITKADILVMAINVASRAASLASRFGVQEIEFNEILEQGNDLLGSLEQGKEPAAESWDFNPSTEAKKILKSFGCPDFKWELIDRRVPVENLAKLVKPSPELDARIKAHTLPRYLQLMRQKDQIFVVDVCEIGMNIAEQLFRLEKAENNLNRQPDNLFGWRIGLSLAMGAGELTTANALGPTWDHSSTVLPVTSPDGQAMFASPEELIMNIASWIQKTYLTSPVF